jgi:HSP20 family protein
MTGDEDRTSRLDTRDAAHNEPRIVDCSARQAAVGTDVAGIDLTLIEKCFTVECRRFAMVNRGSLTGPVFGLRREIDRLFEDTFGGDSRRSGWAPAVDIREDNTEIALEVELPGIKPSDVEVMAENGVLTIRGEKQSGSTEGSEGRYHVVERSYGSFTRSFQLPTGVDEQRIEADFSDGLLTIRIPKAALAQPRRIEIKNSGSQPAIQGTPSKSSSTRGRQDSTQGETAGSGSATRGQK